MIIHLSDTFNSHLAISPISQHGIVFQNLTSFLSLLNTQIGLAYQDISLTQRIVQYLNCLQLKNNENRFYHDSLSVDEFGVAKKLLAWRDQLYLSGWDETIENNGSKRLNDLAEIEKLAAKKVSPNEGQKLGLIKLKLKKYHTQIKKIHL